jgi:hypothetical protein
MGSPLSFIFCIDQLAVSMFPTSVYLHDFRGFFTRFQFQWQIDENCVALQGTGLPARREEWYSWCLTCQTL